MKKLFVVPFIVAVVALSFAPSPKPAAEGGGPLKWMTWAEMQEARAA